MMVELRVTVQVERVQGKFAPKDDIENALIEAIESANPDAIDGVGADGTSEYEVTDWTVESV